MSDIPLCGLMVDTEEKREAFLGFCDNKISMDYKC